MRAAPRPLCGCLRRRAAREEGLRDSPPQDCRYPFKPTMEGARKESSQVPPIATTPPHHDLKEELLSQSSSGTQISNASGVSLGEVIRRRSVINQGTEAWCQSYTEADASSLTVAKGGRLGQAGAGDMSELPTMEEGLVTPRENSRRQQTPHVMHTPVLDIQDSCLSPNLPLMTTYSTQGQTFFSETLFPQTEVDFAPLRGTPDASDTASEDTSKRLHMSEAVRLVATEVSSDCSSDCHSLSQHPLAFSTMAPSNASLGSCLSQHPFSFSGHIATARRPHSEEQRPKDGESGVLGSQPAGCPPEGSWGTHSAQDLFLLDSHVPAPLLLEMLEKEMGLAKDCDFSSSESSSCRSISGKAPEENERSQLMESAVLVAREPETFVEPHQQEETTIPGPASFRVLSDTEGELFRNSKDTEQLPANILQARMSSRGDRIGLGDPCSATGTSGGPVMSEQLVSEASFEEHKRNLVAALAECRLNAPESLQPATVAPACGGTCSKQVNTMEEEAQTGAAKKELTLSDYSIEREHKDTGVSPSFDEGSFFGHLAHPIHHSTPGIFTARNLKEVAAAVAHPAKSILQSPLSCVPEEILKTSFASTRGPSVEEPRGPSGDDSCVPSAEEPLALQSRQEVDTGSSGSLGVLHPLKGRIQSLPCLNFMEKVGAWSLSQSAERMPEALHASNGISPRRKAYSATADPSNSILLRQKSHTDLETSSVPSFCGPVSTASQCSYHKQPPQTFSLTRSHSDNSVIAVSKEALKADVGDKTDYDHQPAESKISVSGASGIKQGGANTEDLLIQRYTAILVSAVSSDEETIESAGRVSNPENVITSDRVAELLREEGNSLSSSQEMSDGSQDNGRELLGFHLGAKQIKMDSFRDVSPDSLNQFTGSGAGSGTDLRLPSRQSSRRSSPLSGKFHSSFEDAPQTSDDGEINIEERIPVYLRNLGIDQSPSSILTPFMPRGPVREIELSPTELRTLKASTDMFTQRLQSSEGDTHSVVDALQSSSSSSALPGVSDPVPTVPPPAKPSPQPSREWVSEFSPVCRQLQLPAPVPAPAAGASETRDAPASPEQKLTSAAVPPDSRSDEETSSTREQWQMDRVHPKEEGPSQEKLSFSSTHEERDGKGLSGKASSLSTIPEGEKDDSCIGSKTLKEIGKPLGEAGARAPTKDLKAASSISSSDLDSCSKQRGEMSGSRGSRFIKGNTPGIQRIWSWDESLARQDFQGGDGLGKTLSLSGSLKWGEPFPVDVCRGEVIAGEQQRAVFQVAGKWHKALDPISRSEPEGCNSVTVNKSLPVLVNSGADSSLCTSGDLREFQATSSVMPLNKSSHPLGNVQQVLDQAKEAGKKEMGSSHESGNGSSVDSLGVKVRNLLQIEHPMAQSAPWVGEQEPCGSGQKPGSSGASSAFSRGEVGVPQSDNSSSLDSLAVRVKTLLENERPVMHAMQILQRAEEEEKKAHAWVKLKLAAHPPCPVPDLNEEDRQMIEDIKRQQCLSARKPDVLKNQLRDNGTQRISSHSLIPELNTGHSNVPGQNDQHKAIYAQHSQVVGFPEVSQVEVGPGHGAGSTFPTDPEITSLTSVQSHAYKQLQTPSDNVLYSRPNFHTPLCNMTDMHLMGQTSASREIVGEERSVLAQAKWTVSSSSTEPAKQITSITFASRKRSHSPSAACAPYPGLPGATPCNLLTFKAQPVSGEQLKSSREQPETFKPLPSQSPTANHKPDMKAGFSSGKHFHKKDSKDELHPEGSTASQGKFQDSCVEQKVHFIMETHEEIQASSQGLPDLRRHKALDNQSDGERAMTDRLFSVNPSLQKTGQACVQGWAGKGPGSFGCEPFFLKGKETTITESKLTFDSHPCSATDAGMGSINPVPPASPDCFSAVVPVHPSPPTKKALSGVHITLSQKCIDLDCPSALDAGPDVKQASGFKMTSEPATSKSPPSEATSRLKPPKNQDSSHFPRPLSSPDSHLRHSPVSGTIKLGSHGSEEGRQHFPAAEEGNAGADDSGEAEGTAKATVASQTQRMSSDAVTQITTESPEKTTYSAEIFVSTGSNEAGAPSPLLLKRDRFPSTATPAVNQTSILEGQAGMPVLLPYKPPGSSEMYYVPCPKETLRLFRVRSETTVESSHSGSNDAVPPEFPPQMLGSWDENPPSAVAIRHREGIYSKRTAPRNAWGEGKMSAQNGVEESTKSGNHSEPVKTTDSVFRSTQFYLHRPVSLQQETEYCPGIEASGQDVSQGRPAATARAFFQNPGVLERSQAPVSAYQTKGDDNFSPLTPELDYSFLKEFSVTRTSKRESPRKERSLPDVRETGHEEAKEQPLPSSPKISLKEKQGADPLWMQGVHLTGRLDELWAKYLERQKHHPQRNPSSNRKELSLVERLDRLARLLQNPVRRSLPAKEEQSCVREQPKGKEPKKISFQGEMTSISKLVSHCKGEESPDATTGTWVSNPRRQNPGDTIAAEPTDGNSEQLQDSETPSDTSSEMRPVKDASVLTDLTSESEATHLETDSASRTEASSSVSTIDTARLIRAFGHNRVQVSPKLSQLYGIIHLQKTCSEKQGKRRRKARGADDPKMPRSEPKRKDSQATDSFVSSDSVSTASGSRGPTLALSHKRSARMLNKAIQAGDFEIVNSATKRHTRDVGLTFPTPASSQARLQGDRRRGTEEEAYRLDGHVSESADKPKRQLSSSLAEKRPRRNKPPGPQGVSWFVPAEDLKLEPRRGNISRPPLEPGPSWFEPLLSTKPWREPLREKNWQEDHCGGLQVLLAPPGRDGENKPPPPFVKMTLQEALALRRPDFISSSGERVKRLKLIIEERKLQSLLQGEREELFNPLEERRSYRSGRRLPPTRDYWTVRRKRAISKSEMVQRSKRIYEQLPEIRKRREEEKRKSDYSTNRLKAQLYKAKITNHVLGRKVPWE